MSSSIACQWWNVAAHGFANMLSASSRQVQRTRESFACESSPTLSSPHHNTTRLQTPATLIPGRVNPLMFRLCAGSVRCFVNPDPLLAAGALERSSLWECPRHDGHRSVISVPTFTAPPLLVPCRTRQPDRPSTLRDTRSKGRRRRRPFPRRRSAVDPESGERRTRSAARPAARCGFRRQALGPPFVSKQRRPQ